MNLRYPLIALLVVTTLTLPSCGNDSKTQNLTVYSGRSEKLVGPIFDDFEAATGIDVAVRYGSSNDLALALSAEGDKTPADVFLSRSPGPIGYLDDLGMLSPLEAGVLARGDARPSRPRAQRLGHHPRHYPGAWTRALTPSPSQGASSQAIASLIHTRKGASKPVQIYISYKGASL